MPKVLSVRFRTSPRIYYFAPADGEEYVKGDIVVVETQRGVETAIVIEPAHDVEESEIVAPLKSVTRLATEAEKEAARADAEKKRDILATAKEKVAQRGLDMKICDCEFTVDHSKLVLYFTAEQRIDFRDLVRDLASAFHIRIDLRQIGSREECKLIGSLGTCGQPCCCGRFESDSEHVSIKMAKNQNLALTPNKINGMCGRLLCCLSYENRTYEDVAKRAPKVGTIVGTPDGRRGIVQSVTPLTETVRLRVGNDDNFELTDYKIDELTFDKANPERPDPPEKRQGFVPQKKQPHPEPADGAEPDKNGKKDRPDRPERNNKDRDKEKHNERKQDRPAPPQDGKQNGGKWGNKKHKHGGKGGKPQKQDEK